MSLLNRRILMMNNMEDEESEDMKRFELIYDSGNTEEEINFFEMIDVTKYSELVIMLDVIKSEQNTTTRYASACFYEDENNSGLIGQVCLAADLSNSNDRKGAICRLALGEDFAVSNGAAAWAYATNVNNGMSSYNIYPNTAGGIFTGRPNYLRIAPVNVSTDHYFGIGSRVVVYGR